MKQVIIAHRGASGLVKFENTIEAFQKAIDVSADSIELDIRKTQDNIIVVVHDDNVNGLKIADTTYKNLINETSKIGYIIPTLEEVIGYCKNKIHLDIEIKEPNYEDEIVNLICKYLNPDEFYIRSFIISSIAKVKAINEKIKTVLLLGVGNPKHGIFTRLSEIFPSYKIRKSKCDIVSPHYRLLILGYTWRVKKPILAWTVNDQAIMEDLLFKKKIAGIITNYPDIAIKLLKEHS